MNPPNPLLNFQYVRVSAEEEHVECNAGSWQGTYVEGIKEEVDLSPAHDLSLIAYGEAILPLVLHLVSWYVLFFAVVWFCWFVKGVMVCALLCYGLV
ncbi:hypothetical protein U1Q18_036687 [Sarracenia purpurea var. burkii]